MFTLSELRYAQKYSFSPVAKRIVKESGLTLTDVPDSVLRRSKSMVSAAFSNQEYMPRIEKSEDLLRNEILAFPVSKIIVSIINRFELYRKFSKMFANSVFKHLEGEKDDVLIDMATDLDLSFLLSDEQNYFVELTLEDYLKPDLEEPFMKLVNREVESGKILLSRIDFTRFVSITASQELRDSLPVKIKEVPSSFKDVADEVEKEFSQSMRKDFSKIDFGKVSPEFFPPCMSKLYSDLMSGQNVNHFGRFVIATFLNSIGMSTSKIIEVFAKTPNFNERTTRYQVERLAGVKGKSYSAPSCDKMRSYNLCVANCKVAHPLKFYLRETTKQNLSENKSEKVSEEKIAN